MRYTLDKWVLLAVVGIILAYPARAQQQSVEERELVEARMDYIDGLAAFENENYQQALELLKAAYVKLPDHAGVNFAIADTYLQLNDLANAEYYGNQATKLEPGNRWYHLKLASIYHAAGKKKAAINELESTLKHAPKDEGLLYELAKGYNEYGKPLKANHIFSKLLNVRGEDLSVRLERLKNFNELNMQDSVVVELQKIRKLDPDNLSTLQILSNYYLEMDKLDEARKVLQNALQIDKEDPRTLIMLSDVYMADAKWDSVGVVLDNVVSDSAVSSETKLKIARYLFAKFKKTPGNQGLRDATGDVFQKMMAAGSESNQIIELVAEFFTQTQQNELALEALRKTTDQVPTNDSAWQQRLRLLLLVGKPKEAITVGEEAAKNIPQDPVILYLLGNAYLSNQNHAEAITNLKEASTLPARKPLKAGILGLLGDAYAGTDKWVPAFKSYEQSLELKPDNPVILNNYAYYLSQLKRNLPQAEEMARKAIELDPENASYLDTLGWVYYQKEEFNKARKYLQSAIDTERASAEVLEHMGDVMAKLNKQEEAKFWWQEALKKDPNRTYLKEKISE